MARLTRYALLLVAAGLCSFGHTPLASARQGSQAGAAPPGPVESLSSARTIFIRSKSVYFKATALEQSLTNRDEFLDWGLSVTRYESDADLLIEVNRKLFTNRFVYNVIDRRTNRVLAGGKIGSLGGSVEGQIADSFIKKMRRIRALAPSVRPK